MKSSSKTYYTNQKKKSLEKWETLRLNRSKYAFKKSFWDALMYGLGISFIVNGLPTIKNLFKYSVFFSLIFLISFLIHFYITFKMKEKFYLKTKKELQH